MCHRIGEGMKADRNEPPMGGAGEVVEADETYIGTKRGVKKARPPPQERRGVLSRARGNVRSFHIDRANIRTISKIVAENVAKESRLHTNESRMYIKVGEGSAAQESVNHGPKE